MSETEYERAWRERGEAEAALRKLRRNSQSPGFVKAMGTLGGTVGFLLMGIAIHDGGWSLIPVFLLGAMFASLAFVGPSVLRDAERARAEAKATLQRLGLWERVNDK